MWKSIMCSPRTAELAMLILLDVLANWPKHSMCTSNEDHTAVLALALSFCNWPLLTPSSPLHQLSILPPPRHLPASGTGLKPGLGAASGPPGLVLPLRLLQASPSHARALPHGHLSTEHCLGLLCPLQATVVMWKILQVPFVPHVVTVYFPHLFVHLLFQILFSTLDVPEAVDTFWKGCQQQHGLATNPNREMHHAPEALCSTIAFYLLGLLSKDTPSCDLAAMAFLVEILECLNLSECRDSVLEVMSKNLQSECRERRRFALRGLVVLGTSVSAVRMWSLHERLVELLQENDSDILRMTIILLSGLLLCNGALITSAFALQLTEALLPLFDNIRLCASSHSQRVLPAHFVPCAFTGLCPGGPEAANAEASRETLRCSARFLHRKDLQWMLQVDQTWRFGESLLAEDRSRAVEHLRHALQHLESPQQSLRQAAIRLMVEIKEKQYTMIAWRLLKLLTPAIQT
ncbi:uncharacterized protein [Anomalospiza imberbis]|uniref:uncharacterized protein n=1 Tax=Anomalospiza imberbis TaxID=187417 RepID=UPI00358ED4D6